MENGKWKIVLDFILRQMRLLNVLWIASSLSFLAMTWRKSFKRVVIARKAMHFVAIHNKNILKTIFHLQNFLQLTS